MLQSIATLQTMVDTLKEVAFSHEDWAGRAAHTIVRPC
jgi:hypothetical protein